MIAQKFILLIETSAELCSVALGTEQGLVAEREINEKNAHNEHLAPLVADILRSEGLKSNDLSALALSAGPGSYTGLRIGASLAKGICFPHSIPLIAISTLSALAEAIQEKHPDANLICPLIDARRMDAYCTLFDGGLKPILPEVFCTFDEEFMEEYLKKENICFGGSGAEKLAGLLQHPRAVFTEVRSVHARHLYPAALDKWKNSHFEDLAYFEPNYIKPVYINSPGGDFKF